MVSSSPELRRQLLVWPLLSLYFKLIHILGQPLALAIENLGAKLILSHGGRLPLNLLQFRGRVFRDIHAQLAARSRSPARVNDLESDSGSRNRVPVII